MFATKKAISTSATVLLALGMAGGLATPSYATGNASETATQSSEDVLAQFRNGISNEARNGDSTAINDLKKFDALTESQRNELRGYLDGSKSIPEKTTGDVQIVNTSGINTVAGKTDRSATLAASSTKDVWATEAFTFAGIKISETKAIGKYEVSNGTVTKTVSQGCTVEKSYNPMQQVSSNNNSHYVSDGKAVFECKVTSVYGLPNVVEASKREGVQFLEADGAGNVVANGWR